MLVMPSRKMSSWAHLGGSAMLLNSDSSVTLLLNMTIEGSKQLDRANLLQLIFDISKVAYLLDEGRN